MQKKQREVASVVLLFFNLHTCLRSYRRWTRKRKNLFEKKNSTCVHSKSRFKWFLIKKKLNTYESCGPFDGFARGLVCKVVNVSLSSSSSLSLF